MTYRPLGWFADVAGPNDPEHMIRGKWFGVLQIDGMVATLDGPWFDTEEACTAWLRAEVAGRGMLEDHR